VPVSPDGPDGTVDGAGATMEGEADTTVDGATDTTTDGEPYEADTGGENVPRRGRFVDAAVTGLGWSTASGAGVTGPDGEFDYRAGESVTFSIGDIELPAAAGAETVTALDVFRTRDTNSTPVANLNRLLQTLDADGDPGNGIRIDPAAALAATGLEVDFAAADFEQRVVNLVANANSPTTSLVSVQRATTHFVGTLTAEGIDASGCASTHPLVGRAVPLVGTAHDVGGRVTVLDDCTFEVSGFDYDGGGPDVGFYAGLGDDYGQAPVRLTPPLDGLVYTDDALRLTLPEGTTLDDVDRLSVWCFDFAVSFGDALLQDGP